jgi:predicted SnoaL-like aldol condensation-catalyzing enzyme
MNEPPENRKLIETFCNEVINNHDFSGLDWLMRDDYVQHNADCPQGKAGFIEFFTTIFSAVPDFRYAIKAIVADGDLAFVYARTLGTHTGGPWLGVPASGNRLDFDVVDMFRIKDGKIAEHWDVADTYAFFSQLGRIPRSDNL